MKQRTTTTEPLQLDLKSVTRRVFKPRLVDDVLVWFGFGCVLSWIFLISWGSPAMVAFSRAGLDSMSARGTVAVGEAVAAAILFVFFRKWGGPVAPAITWLAALVAAAGTLVMTATDLPIVPKPVYLIVAALAGAGYGVVFILWSQYIGRQKPWDILALAGMSIITASLLDALIIHASRLGFSVCAAVLPVVSLLVLLKARTVLPVRAASPRPRARAKIPAQIVLPLIVAGLSYGLMQRLTLSGSQIDDTANVGAIFTAGLLLVLTIPFFVRERVYRTVFPVAFSFVAVAYVLLALLPGQTTLVQYTYLLGFAYFNFLLWAMCARVVGAFGISVGEAYAGITFVLAGGESVAGALSGGAIATLSSQTYSSVISLVAMFAFMVTALVSFPFFQRNWTVAGNEAGAQEAHPKLAHICDEYGLSPRESEVLELLARGRNCAYIGQKLFISSETVRVHMKSIYKKMAVHSQQELLNLLDSK